LVTHCTPQGIGEPVIRRMENQPSGKSPKRKILVVDDNAIVVKTLSFKLKSGGYDVITAVDGSEAVKAARSQKPDLILLDISFPPDVAFGGGVPWDGFLIIDWLRRMDEARNVPIIIISGGDPAKFEQRSKAAGAVGFFQKPIDHDRLLEAIRSVLETPKSG
jgi:CheY-like chemotaxis protein